MVKSTPVVDLDVSIRRLKKLKTAELLLYELQQTPDLNVFWEVEKQSQDMLQ